MLRQIMKSRHLVSSKSCFSNESGKEVAANEVGGEVVPGDVIWVRLHSCSWWPAQVVDENTVSRSNKPGKRSAGDVLVRLYGSYKYMYADPTKSCSEFEIILKQNNGSYSEIFQKALEQDHLHLKFGRLKGQGSKSKANPRVKASIGNKLIQKQVKENREIRASNCVRISPRRQPATTTSKTKVKNGTILSKEAVEAQSKTSKQDGVRKKLKTCKECTEEEASKGHKEDEVQKNLEPNSPSSATIHLGKSQELSGRRMRVMQSLGLIAPSGSPFHRNGDIYLSM